MKTENEDKCHFFFWHLSDKKVTKTKMKMKITAKKNCDIYPGEKKNKNKKKNENDDKCQKLFGIYPGEKKKTKMKINAKNFLAFNLEKKFQKNENRK